MDLASDGFELSLPSSHNFYHKNSRRRFLQEMMLFYRFPPINFPVQYHGHPVS